jgi:hypothetical protein
MIEVSKLYIMGRGDPFPEIILQNIELLILLVK